MSAITLHQPWASLVALGVKTIETRSWKPPAAAIGERLLIHAAVNNTAERWVGDWLCTKRPAVTLPNGDVLPSKWLLCSDSRRPDEIVPLQHGAIVASCILAGAVPMVVAGTVDALSAMRLRSSGALVVNPDGPEMAYYHPQMADDEMSRDVSDQRPYGDFAPGRWAWLLEDVEPTTERCPACWGEICEKPLGTGYGDVPCVLRPEHEGSCNSFAFDDRLEPWCPYCRGLDGCPPIPAKGHQRVWDWTP